MIRRIRFSEGFIKDGLQKAIKSKKLDMVISWWMLDMTLWGHKRELCVVNRDESKDTPCDHYVRTFHGKWDIARASRALKRELTKIAKYEAKHS